MKALNFILFLALQYPFCLTAQDSTNNANVYPNFFKANVLQSSSTQQWSFSFEKLHKFRRRSNSFGIVRNVLCNFYGENSSRKSVGFTYRKYFYIKPIFNKTTLFLAPYSKVLYRKVNQEGSRGGFVIFSSQPRNFTSTSIILGSETGIQVDFLKRMVGSLNMGGGLGYVVKYKSKQGDYYPSYFHLDALFQTQIGFKF